MTLLTFPPRLNLFISVLLFSRPAAADMIDDLKAAYVSGSGHGFIAGVIVSLGLVYFRRRWLSRPSPRKLRRGGARPFASP
jgi:hypothetical protein